jgi:hypothetical protein
MVGAEGWELLVAGAVVLRGEILAGGVPGAVVKAVVAVPIVGGGDDGGDASDDDGTGNEDEWFEGIHGRYWRGRMMRKKTMRMMSLMMAVGSMDAELLGRC